MEIKIEPNASSCAKQESYKTPQRDVNVIKITATFYDCNIKKY